MSTGVIYAAIFVLGMTNAPQISVGDPHVSDANYFCVISDAWIAGGKDILVLNASPSFDATIIDNDIFSNATLSIITNDFAPELLFNSFKMEWKNETAGYSSIDKKVNHPAYRQIIEIGPEAIALILKELQNEPGHWFAALREITKENPVQLQHRGNIAEMTNDWLRWARENHLFG